MHNTQPHGLDPNPQPSPKGLVCKSTRQCIFTVNGYLVAALLDTCQNLGQNKYGDVLLYHIAGHNSATGVLAVLNLLSSIPLHHVSDAEWLRQCTPCSRLKLTSSC